MPRGRTAILSTAAFGFLLSAAMLGSLLAPTWAAAQPRSETSDQDLAEARARFLAGSEAVSEERWADAVREFERAYQLSRVPPALFNLAVAHRALGHYVEARRAVDLLLARHRAQLPTAMLRNADELRAEVSAKVAALVLRGLDPGPLYDVRLDGRPQEDIGDRPWTVETDPGRHNLLVRRESHRPFTWEGELAAGSRQRLEVDLELIPEDELPRDPQEDDGGLLSSPAFWIVTVAVLAAAGGTTAYFLLRDDGVLDPNSNMPVNVP